jgi:predicted RecB family nuclease
MKYSAHSTYLNTDKIEVPSVTTVLKILNKPFLQKWANIMGFKRKKIEDILESSSIVGTMVHQIIEAYMLQKFYVFIPTAKHLREVAMAHLNSFIEWQRTHSNVTPIFMEKHLSSQKFGGTIDFYGMVDGKHTILDFKTSKQPYSSYFLQLAAYCIMLEEQGHKVEQAAIIIINQTGYNEKFIKREELESYIQAFKTLVEFFHAWYDLNISDGWGNILS